MSATATSPLRPVQEQSQTDLETTQRPKTLNHEDIALLAYTLWQSRGCPHGSPEEDWFAAEEKIRASHDIPTGEIPASHQVGEKIGPSAEHARLGPHTELERIA